MGLCSARWEGAAYVILEVRLKRCRFWLLVLCMLGSFYFSLKLCNFEADLVKIKYVLLEIVRWLERCGETWVLRRMTGGFTV